MNKKLFIFCFIFFIFSTLNAEDIVHIIEKGETLYSLSKKYNVSVSVILETNKIKDASKIKAGQKLIIPQEKKSGKITEKTDTEKNTALKTGTYIVQKGDSLFGLAKKFGVNFSEFLKLNNLTSESLIKIGDKLKIPQTKTAQTQKEEKRNKVKSGETPFSNSKQADSKLLWPVPASEVSYLSGKIAGVVIDSKKGQAVKAISSGKVVSTGQHRGFGQVVFVQSKTKHIYVYGGMEKLSVKKGETVKTGQKLGEVGMEIFTNKARMYFMVYDKNKPIDPEKAPRGL